MRTTSLHTLCVLLLTCSSWAQAQPQGDGGDDLQRARLLLDELEDVYGQMDPRLAEPLLQLGEQLMQAGYFAEAHRHLDRAAQITRINEGLYTRSQLPILRRKIENLANQGDWDNARTQLQHLFWLYRTKSRRIDSVLVNDLSHLASMHLRGITEDVYDNQGYHFRRALNANWMALAVGEAIWGERDERLNPLLYSLIKQYHLQAVAVGQGGATSYHLRLVSPQSERMRQRSDVLTRYYFAGLGLLERLEAIYGNAEPVQPEALAMTSLYLADWQVLFGRHGEALLTYRQAWQGLEAAGIERTTLEHFFSKPSLLPEPRFHTGIEQAMAARNETPGLEPASEPNDDYLEFAEWGSAFPYVNRPTELDDRIVPDSGFALFSFNLTGVPDVPRLINNRNSTAFSRAQDARLVNDIAASREEEESLLERLEWLQFRPRLSDGLPGGAAATLKYRFAPASPNQAQAVTGRAR